MNAAAAHDGTAARPAVLFIMGLGRSGTSALTRVLSLSGGTLPPAMLGATASNPRGNWEPRPAIHLNESILQRHGSSAYDPTLRLEEKGAFDAEENAASIAKIRAYLTTLPGAPLVVIKEGRITLLSGMWFEAARQAGLDIAPVIAVRHPQEVIGSLEKHIGASPELASALWLKYMLLAERHTRGMPRVFVEYSNLLDDWRREIKRISAAFPIDLNARDEGAIDEFLEPDLRRQRDYDPVTKFFGTDWISEVYEAVSAAARDEPWDESALDRIFETYQASEHGFRTASEDFRDHFSGVVHRPFIMKLILEGFAWRHRRSGTWA